MTDEEIRAFRDTFAHTPGLTHRLWEKALVQLATEALRRGEEMARLRVDLERIASGDDNEWDRLRERLSRLEAALRFYADTATWFRPIVHHATDHEGFGPRTIDIDGGEKARAALEEKP